MPRHPRTHVKDGLYHVFNQTAHERACLTQPEQATALQQLLADTARRDGVTIHAWCILPSCYHLALTISDCPLSRTMRTVQHHLAVSYNRRHHIFGPFWQGRYRAMVLPERDRLAQLVAYVHLQPVVQGLAATPEAYKLSGHRELKGHRVARLIGVSETLHELGSTRHTARYRYTQLLQQTRPAAWITGGPGGLPWWRHGRPPAGSTPLHERDLQLLSRPRHEPIALLRSACQLLQVPHELLRSRLKSRELVHARKLLTFALLEHFDVKTSELARILAKSPESVSKWYATALRRRLEDEQFRAQCHELSQQLQRRFLDRTSTHPRGGSDTVG